MCSHPDTVHSPLATFIAIKVNLKNLSEQVIVITGASSGISLVTARLAAKADAKLVLASRSGDALRQLSDEINCAGGQAIYVTADCQPADRCAAHCLGGSGALRRLRYVD